MIKNVVFLSLKENVPSNSYWDQTLLKDILRSCDHWYTTGYIPDDMDEAIVVIPGAYQADVVREINRELSKLKRCQVVITSDEENNFPLDKLKHPNMRLFATYPHKTKAKVTWLPIGYPTIMKDVVVGLPNKEVDVFFSGQINHKSREDMLKELDILSSEKEVVVYGNSTFASGLTPENYYPGLASAKVAPAPKGNISPDSFRLYEALESGCVPIAENPEFWNTLFGSYPFPAIDKSEQWRGYINDALNQYPVLNNRCQSWWLRYKQFIKDKFIDKDIVTVVIPVSPIPSHPDTSILEETVKSVRHHFPKAQIVITFDGVREEQKDKTADYEEHIRRVLWKCKEWGNVYPIIYDEHLHQVGMMREILKNHITTPLIVYVEQDTPFVTDVSIDWEKIMNKIITGESNLVRFHFEAFIPEEHKYLMIGEAEDDLLKTAQWSQRPHIASTAFYQRILNDNFSNEAKCFIEDLIHGKVLEDFNHYGEQGWNQWRIHIYHPEGNIKRSLHLDGRAGSQKYDNTQVW